MHAANQPAALYSLLHLATQYILMSVAITTHAIVFACREPEALPFCALSYSMVGILSTLLAAIPAVRNLLMSLVA